MIRAKFKVDSKTESLWSNPTRVVVDVKLSPVYQGSDENKAFYAATPGGQINVTCARKEVADAFELGREYYVDFTPAEAPTT